MTEDTTETAHAVCEELDAIAAAPVNPTAARHSRHAALMLAQDHRKQQRREDHRRRKEFRSCPPNVLV